MLGAARLVALSARKIGCGLSTIKIIKKLKKNSRRTDFMLLKERIFFAEKLKYKEIQQGFSYFRTFLRYFAV